MTIDEPNEAFQLNMCHDNRTISFMFAQRAVLPRCSACTRADAPW